MSFCYNLVMNFNQIKQVLVVAEEKNFTNAAKKLFISQPSLSKSIKLLEEEFGVEIFERNPIKLTHAGEVFVKKAKKIISEIGELEIEMSDISNQLKTYIVIGVPSHRCYCFMPKILKELHEEYPNCYVKIEEYPTFILKKMLEEDKIDFYLGTENPDSLIYKTEHICDETAFITFPKNWEIKSDGEEIDIKKFRDKNFIIFPEQLKLSKYLKSLCEENGFEPKTIIECHNAETIYSMINEGIGASFLPELFIKNFSEQKNVVYKKIKGYNFKREFAIFYKKDKYLVKPAIRFLELFNKIH